MAHRHACRRAHKIKTVLKHISKSGELLGCSIEDVQMANKHVKTRLPPLHSAFHEDN